MKVKVTRNRQTKRISVSIRAESERDKDTLTMAVVSGRLICSLNKAVGAKGRP